MRYYPIAIDTKNKDILVLGGGRAAYLKLKKLVNTYAIITVISKEFCQDIINLQKSNNEKLILIIKTIDRERLDFSDEYSMVFICTDDIDLNIELYKHFKYKKVLAMMSDNRESSDFISSAVLEKENIIIAFNTEGRSPTAAKLLLKETEKILTDELIEKIDLICKIREKYKSQKCDVVSNKEDPHYIMRSIALCTNKELEEKLKILNKIKGDQL